MGALLDAIVETIPAPLSCDRNAPFQMLVTSISSDPYVGRISTGYHFESVEVCNVRINPLWNVGKSSRAKCKWEICCDAC